MIYALGFGSNKSSKIGNKFSNYKFTISELNKRNIRVITKSNLYITPPKDMTLPSDNFINAALIIETSLKPLKLIKEEDFHKCMKLNLYSAVEIIKSYQDTLKENNGAIVFFSTVAAQRGFTNHSIIASTKAAVEGLTVSLAAEFAPYIRVNCIAPSLTNSKIAKPMLKNEAIAKGIAKAHPLKRLGEGKDSASLAKFLITEDSAWVTGQIIAVDGGRSKLS